MKKLLIIDGHALIHRAFHAMPPLTSANGTPTNAVYGFFNMFYKAIVDFQPTHIAVCFDTPTPTFRKELLESYQASRPELPSELAIQIDLIKNLLAAADVTCLEKPGFEADDVIGTLVEKFQGEDSIEIYILTGDKDILQLVKPHVKVIMPKIGLSDVVLYHPEQVVEKMGLPPKMIPDYKALAGDPSDNYTGVKGLGPKTAISLLTQFHSVENLFSNLDKVEKEKLRNLLKDHTEDVKLYKTIATIRHDVDVQIKLEDMLLQPYSEKLQIAFEEYQLNSLIKRYFPDAVIQPKIKPVKKPEATETKKKTSQMDLF